MKFHGFPSFSIREMVSGSRQITTPDCLIGLRARTLGTLPCPELRLGFQLRRNTYQVRRGAAESNGLPEHRREVMVAVILATVGAIGLGLVTIAAFSNGSETPSSTSPLSGFLSVQSVSCSSATLTCTMTIVNRSPAPLVLQSCLIQVETSSHDASVRLEGTVSGQATRGIPANSSVLAGCSLLPSATTPSSSNVSGFLNLVLQAGWKSYTAGTATSISFAGTWS